MQQHGVTIAEGAAGFLGVADGRPATPTTPWPLLEISALLPALAVHALAARSISARSLRK